MLRRFHQPKNAQQHPDDSRDQRALTKAVNTIRRPVILRAHSVFPPDSLLPPFFGAAGGCKTLSRMSRGSSLSLALRLNCKARTYDTMAHRSRGAICAE